MAKLSTPSGISPILNNQSAIYFFPNPSNGIFTLQAKSEELKGKNIEVFNVFGVCVLTEILHSTQDDKVIDLSSNPNGVYFYRVIKETGEKVGEGKLIIQK